MKKKIGTVKLENMSQLQWLKQVLTLYIYREHLSYIKNEPFNGSKQKVS